MTLSFLLLSLAFVLLVPWGEWVVRALLRRGIGKRIRTDGPASHRTKSGTATMGGLYILVGIALFTMALALAGHPVLLLPLAAMLGFGLLGAYDDVQGLRDVQGVGWLARSKFVWQWMLALVLALISFAAVDRHLMIVPMTDLVYELGWWFVPLTAGLLVAATNAVNLTDGLDGLAGGTSAIALAAYGLIAALSGRDDLSWFCFSLVGVLLAFLWFNVHPARMFMGDTGSQALGAGLAMVAVLSGHWLLLPLVGIVFVAVALSVILQVAYFKWTRRLYGEGRRLFRMAPLHHHLELVGWSEVQITLRFWIVAASFAALAVALAGGQR